MLFIFMSVTGCILSHHFTPAEIDKNAKKYCIDAGVADANDFDGWHNLIMAAKLKELVDIAHQVTQQKLDQMKDVDKLQHAIHQKTTTTNYTEGLKREEALFGETGFISLGLTLMGVSGAGVLGLMRKRPKDFTPEEMQSALAEVQGKSVEELSAKEKHFTQLVKGVQTFVTDHKQNGTNGMGELLTKLKTVVASSENPAAMKAVEEISNYLGTWNGDVILSLKAAMDKYQDTETKNHVSAVKNDMV
jgi:hypothetical protein